jgi:hypothetical protein
MVAALRSPVIYHHGPTNIAKTEPAMMEWTADGQLRLWREPTVTGGAQEDIVRLSPQEITKVSDSMIRVVIHTASAKYWLDIVSDSSVNPNFGTVADRALEQQLQYKASNVKEWIESFRQHGVTVSYMDARKTWLMSGIIAGVIIIAAAIYAVAVS